MKAEIDHDYTPNIVCPWCGAVIWDSWEIEPDAILFELGCPACGKEFHTERHVTIEYSTRTADKCV